VPSKSFHHTAVASAPIDDVWAALDQPQTWESIGGIDRVVDSNIDADGRLRGFSFDTVVAGVPYRGKATPAGREEGRLISWNIENAEIAGTITVTLLAEDSETTITVALTVESKGMLAAMFFSAVSKAIGTGLPGSVDAFASSFGGPDE